MQVNILSILDIKTERDLYKENPPTHRLLSNHIDLLQGERNMFRSVHRQEYLRCAKGHCVHIWMHVHLIWLDRGIWKSLLNLNTKYVSTISIKCQKEKEKRNFFYVPDSNMVFQWLHYPEHLVKIEIDAH